MIIPISILVCATSHVVNKGSWNARGGRLKIVEIIDIKWNWWFVHKNIRIAMQTGSQMLVKLIDWISWGLIDSKGKMHKNLGNCNG